LEVLQVPSELASMVALYLERQPKRILEIGSWDGGTLKVWLENAPRGATVVAVDLEHRNAVTYHEWERGDVTLILRAGSSLDDEGRDFIRRHGPYDWAFIDGDHTAPGVQGDIDTCLPLVAPGGLMLLHDITPCAGDDTCPPLDAFRDLGERYETWTYQDLTPATWTRGIGVVQL
jgi:predicted O-methyltransferase YrrM